MGVLSGLETALGSRAANGGFQKAVVGVEVRVNDVCVDVISTSSETKSHGVGAASVAVPELPQDTPGVQRSATGKLHRGKGTIKRIWKRVVGTVKH